MTVIVVTWNSSRVLPGLMQSLPAAMGGLDWDVVLVDNGSDDDTVEVARRCLPSVTIVQTGHNAGYAAGVNAGCEVAESYDAILLVNPDVRMMPGSVEALATALGRNRTGIAVPRIHDQQGNLSFTLRRDPSVRRLLGEALLGGHRAGRFAPFGETIVDASFYERASTVDWAGGAVMLVSRECLQTVGAWDESFWMYSEEIDFALRARERGFVLRYEPSARVTHLEGDVNTDPRLWAQLVVNRVKLFRRRHNPVHGWIFWGAAVLNEAVRTLSGRPTSRAALAALFDEAGSRRRATDINGRPSRPGDIDQS